MRRGVRLWLPCALGLAALGFLVGRLPAQESPVPGGKMRTLSGKDLQEAWEAMRRVEGLHNEFGARYPWQPSGVRGQTRLPTAPEAAEERERIVSARKEIMEKYRGTDVAAYCALRLTGFYKYCRELDKAVDQAKEVAREFAGTPYEVKAHFSLGATYLQSLRDPREAAKWFARIPRPGTAETIDPAHYDEAAKMYLSAQKQIAKCELEMGKPDRAARRYERLEGMFPQFKEELAQAHEFERRVDAQRRTGLDPESVLENRIYMDPLFGLDAAEASGLAEEPQLDSRTPRPVSQAVAAGSSQQDVVAGPASKGVWAGVGLIAAGTGVSLFGVSRLVALRRTGKEKSHV